MDFVWTFYIQVGSKSIEVESQNKSDDMISHMICECCKLVQKDYKTRYDLVRKVITKEWCKKLKFDHTPKWYMHTSESILENQMK